MLSDLEEAGDHARIFALDETGSGTGSGAALAAGCPCPVCGGQALTPEYFLPPTSGTAPNGKPVYSWDQAAAQLTRQGDTWSAVLGGAVTVTYAYRDTAPAQMPDDTSGFSRFSATQIAFTEEALQLWAEVANITFVRVNPAGYSNNASMLFANYSSGVDGAAAFAYGPRPHLTGSGSVAGDVWINISQSPNANLAFGDYGPHTLAHEIGHAIGLDHPGDYNGGSPTYSADAPYWQDARMFTIMSYFGSSNTGGNLPLFSVGPQLHDIAAAQRLYGPNMTTRTGNTTYGFNSNTGHQHTTIASATSGAVFAIWDAGGIDTLDLSGYNTPSEIDLREEAFSSAGPGNDGNVAVGNISIARGAVIENAIGGGGNDTIIGNAADNLLIGNGGADAISGNDGNDTLIGGAGGDALDGGAGSDTADYSASSSGVTVNLATNSASGGDAAGDSLVSIENLSGSAQDDSLTGDSADNLLRGGDGADYLNGGGGSDTADYETSSAGVTVSLVSGVGSGGHAAGDALISIENLNGSAFADILTGDGAANILRGRGGDDRLIGGAGSDTLDGGAGSDTADYSASSAGISINLGTASASGGHAAGDTLISIENIIGSGHADVIVGDNNANILRGGAGGDTLNGAGGSDTADYSTSSGEVSINLATSSLSGGDAEGDTLISIENLIGSAFNDILTGDSGVNRIEGGDGDDTLDGGAGVDTVSYRAALAGVVVSLANSGAQNTQGAGVDTLSGFENLEGSGFNDNLYGDANANVFWGLAGNDTIWAGAGDDTAVGGAGNDYMVGEQGADALWGEDGDDTLWGGAGNDYLVGAGGNDTMWGEDGDDTLWGGAGNDLLVGGPGDDALWGEEGDDTLWGNSGSNYLVGGPGNDAIWGDVGNDTLWGGTGSDTLVGLTGDDTLWGEDGDDFLWGGDGNDTLIAGLGSEVLRGEAGDDTLWGGSDGVDWLVGGPGNDILWGEGGQDFFYFDSLDVGFDHIQDLVKGEDYVAFNSAAFGISSLTPGGNFISGGSPVSVLAAPTLLFNTSTYILSYDPDGSGAAAAIQIAQTYVLLAASDFVFA